MKHLLPNSAFGMSYILEGSYFVVTEIFSETISCQNKLRLILGFANFYSENKLYETEDGYVVKGNITFNL